MSTIRDIPGAVRHDPLFLVNLSRTIHDKATKMTGEDSKKFPRYSAAVHIRIQELAGPHYAGHSLSGLVWLALVKQTSSGLPKYIVDRFYKIPPLREDPEDLRVDQPALKLALSHNGPPGILDRFLREIERQLAVKRTRIERVQPPVFQTCHPRLPAVKKEEQHSVSDRMPTPQPSWSPEILRAFERGDLNGLKQALGGVGESFGPQTLQDQIDAHYPPVDNVYGPWGVPLPSMVKPEVDLGNTEAVSACLHGLIIKYDKKTHSVQVRLPADMQDSPPVRLETAEVFRFAKATAIIWKWVGCMKKEKGAISLDLWCQEQVEKEQDKSLRLIHENIQNYDTIAVNKLVKRKSTTTQKRKALLEDDSGVDDHDQNSVSTTKSAKRTKRH